MYHNDFEPFERNTENLTESEPMSAYGQPQQTATGYTPQHGSYAEEPVRYEPYNTATEPQGSGYAAESVHYEPYNAAAEPQGGGYAEEPMHYEPYNTAGEPQGRNKKKSKKTVGVVAAAVAAGVMLSGVAGFGGSYLFSKLNTPSNNTSAVQINKASTDNNISNMSVQQTDKSTNEIVNEVADSVVEIKVEIMQSNPFYGQSVAEGAGSGVIISEDGYILTNNHVIDGASNITVTLRSGDSYEAQLIGTDPDVDIALVKIEASGLSAATIGDSSQIKPGDKSVIIGNPLGTLGGSVTEGIVSAVDRTLEIDGKTMHLMQTDAAVNPGNSGGGMFNGQGELAGIVVAKTSDSTIDNIGFVIPINNALDILGDLKQYGYVRGKASTGMAFSEGDPMFAQYYFNMSDGGLYVASIKSGSNAEKAGFQVGDRVIAVDNTEVTSVSDLKAILSEHAVGDTLSFELERDGRTGTIDLTLEEYSPAATA